MTALAREATADVNVFLVGGTSAVLLGWRDSTMDVDLAVRPENDAMLRAIPHLKERLHLNVEFASPDLFIPVPAMSHEYREIGAALGGERFLSAIRTTASSATTKP